MSNDEKQIRSGVEKELHDEGKGRKGEPMRRTHKRPAVAKLGAAGSKCRTTVSPLHLISPEEVTMMRMEEVSFQEVT